MERAAARREKRRSQLCPIPSRHAIRRTSSPNSASDRWPIVSRLTELVGNRGMTLFAVMDQSGEARLAGLQLRDTTLVIFGSPVQVTPVVASPAPKVVVPRQRRETRSPVLPKVLYCMVFPHSVDFLESGTSKATWTISTAYAQPLGSLRHARRYRIASAALAYGSLPAIALPQVLHRCDEFCRRRKAPRR